MRFVSAAPWLGQPLLIGASVLLAVGSAGSRAEGVDHSVDTYAGRCEKLVVLSKDWTHDCLGRFSRIIEGDGRVELLFSYKGRSHARLLLSFYSDDRSPDVLRSNALVLRPVATLSYMDDSSGTGTIAVGGCRELVPLGKGGMVECVAETPRGLFEARFVASGPPVEQVRP